MFFFNVLFYFFFSIATRQSRCTQSCFLFSSLLIHSFSFLKHIIQHRRDAQLLGVAWRAPGVRRREGGGEAGRRTSPHLVAEPDQLRVAVGHQVQVAVLHLHGVDAPAEALVVCPRQPVRDSG